MRVILCDVCSRKIVNSPVVKMKISYDYPETTTPVKEQLFVAVSGLTMMNPGWGYYNPRSGHELEMCMQCAQYTDYALKHLQKELNNRKAPETEQPIVHPPPIERDPNPEDQDENPLYNKTGVSLSTNTYKDI